MLHEIIKNTVPEYTCKLPVTKKEVKFRPLLVKEEKLIAQVSELSELFSDKVYSLSKLVDSCCNEDIESIRLPIYDFQCLLLDIRKRSITEQTQLRIRCPYTGEPVIVDVNFSDILNNKVEIKKQYELKINDSTVIRVKNPTVSDLLKSSGDLTEESELMVFIANVLSELETKEKTLDLNSESTEEKLKMLEMLKREEYLKLKEFVMQSFFILNLKYQTSDLTERTVKVSDFANFLRYYSATLN